MRYQNRTAGQRPIYFGIFFCYAVFLLLDAFRIHPLLSDILKYISIFLCAARAFYDAPPGRGSLRLAFLLTLVCDALLLFTPLHTPGILLFCGVHILNGIRLSRNRRRMALLLGAACAAVGAIALLPGVAQRFSARDRAGALYAACLLLCLGAAAHAALRTRAPWAWRGFAGQALFLLCDVCVMLFNRLPPERSGVPGFLMWFFYLPAQALLAGSEEVQERGRNK